MKLQFKFDETSLESVEKLKQRGCEVFILNSNCQYKILRLTCRLYSTLVAVFKENSQFRRYGEQFKNVRKQNIGYYLKGTIYGPASGFIIREKFDGRPLFELEREMRKIGGYKEEVLQA